MKFLKNKSTFLYVFLLAVLLVVVYKLIDHVDSLWWGIKRIFAALSPFIVGAVIAYILNRPCKFFARLYSKSKWKFISKNNYGLGIFTVYAIIVILFVLAIRLIVPALYNNVKDLFANLPMYAERALVLVNEWQARLGISIINTETISFPNAVKYFIKEVDLSQFGKYAEGIITATSGLINVFIALIVSVYICIDKERIESGAKRITSIIFLKDKADSIFRYVAKVDDIFSKYIYCKLLEASMVAIISTVVLAVMGVKYSLFLGIMIGLFNFIPYFGSIIASVIAVIITAFSTGIFTAIWVLVVLLVIEQIDGNFIGPKIIGDSLNMRPILVLFAVTVGGALFGMIGLLLSVPIFIIIKMMIDDWLSDRESRLAKAKPESKTTNKEGE